MYKSPADIDPAAKPYSEKPSASVMTKTSDAIEQLGKEDVVQEWEKGTYWVDRTVSVNGGSSKQVPKQIYFNQTEIRAAGNVGNYTTVRSEDNGGDLNGLNDANDNLPTGETTPVLLDVTNSNYSRYLGLLTVNANNLGLACIAATNRHKQNGAGGIGSTWDNVVLKSGRWGLFGTPRYGGERNFYAGAFVGNIWQRLRITSCPIPILLASNTGDDQFFGELNLINPAGGRSYMFAVNVNYGSCYLSGDSFDDYAIDIQKASLVGGTLYAEGHFATPIILRNRGHLHATPKYGSGSVTVFADKAFVTHDGKEGGGELWAEPTTANSNDAEALVALKAVSGSRRNWIVNAPFPESDVKPYKALGSLSGKDTLLSVFSEGAARWTGPSLTREAGWS